MKRVPNRKEGYTAVTAQELKRGRNKTVGASSNTNSTRLISTSFTSVDYVADGSLYKLTWVHGIKTLIYFYQIFESSDGSEVILTKVHRGHEELTMWFRQNVKDITVLLVY